MRVRSVLMVGVLLALGVAPGAAQRAGAPKLGVDGLVIFRYLPEYASARAQGQIFQLLLSESAFSADPEGAVQRVPTMIHRRYR